LKQYKIFDAGALSRNLWAPVEINLVRLTRELNKFSSVKETGIFRLEICSLQITFFLVRGVYIVAE
jgi:hypothetical protein